jgi:hypothetical protein
MSDTVGETARPGAGLEAPVLPRRSPLDRQVPDPAGPSAGEVRAVRGDVDARVRAPSTRLCPAAAR